MMKSRRLMGAIPFAAGSGSRSSPSFRGTLGTGLKINAFASNAKCQTWTTCSTRHASKSSLASY